MEAALESTTFAFLDKPLDMSIRSDKWLSGCMFISHALFMSRAANVKCIARLRLHSVVLDQSARDVQKTRRPSQTFETIRRRIMGRMTEESMCGALGHSFLYSLICAHHSLISLLAPLARSAAQTLSLARSLSHSGALWIECVYFLQFLPTVRRPLHQMGKKKRI